MRLSNERIKSLQALLRELYGLDYNEECTLLSFHTYPDQNRAWCYSCNGGGYSIKFYMLIHGCDFKTAVTELAGGMR
jgi:hypothetical protein